jgi:RNA polymerase sigma factor (sigma-70 family)
MKLAEESIIAKIEESLSRLTAANGDQTGAEIKPILMNNLLHHRVETFIEDDLDRIDAYIALINEKYAHWHRYLYAVQIQRDHLVWNPLFPQLISFAYAFFIRKGFDASVNTHDYAQESATAAAEAILKAQFPYDTDFEPWAHRIVQIHCLRFMRDQMRKQEIPTDHLVELSDEIEAPTAEENDLQPLIDAELQAALAAAIGQLSPARQDVIRWRYFDQLSFTEIAERMGKSMDAVYGLQFNALHDLRKILLKTGITFNEE